MLENLIDSIIPVIAIISIFALPPIAIVVVLLKFNASKRAERMALIKQGIIPQEAENKRTPNRLRTLRTALGAIGGGIGAIVGIILTKVAFSSDGLIIQSIVVAGSTLIIYGIAFVIYYLISKDKIEMENTEE